MDLSPDLLEELKAHRVTTSYSDADDFVFPTSRGTQQDRSNVLKRVLRPAIRAANEVLTERGMEQIPPNLTMHSRCAKRSPGGRAGHPACRRLARGSAVGWLRLCVGGKDAR